MTANPKNANSNEKVAIVTGGSRGLGRSMVLALAARGVHSIFTYHSRRDEAEKVAVAAKEAGANALFYQLDASDTRLFDAFAQNVREGLKEFGRDRFDYLINNAGTALRKNFTETTEEELDAIYRVHFKGVFFLTQKLLPLLADRGRILNISSGLTRMTFPGLSAYASMKTAVETLTRYLSKELGPRRITVNTVAPGAIATDFGGGTVRDNPELNKHIAEATALGRVGLPEDIGPMVAALLDDANRWVNAQRIEVSGGQGL